MKSQDSSVSKTLMRPPYIYGACSKPLTQRGVRTEEKQAQARVLFHNIIIISYNDVFIGINNAHFLNFVIAGREVRNGFLSIHLNNIRL